MASYLSKFMGLFFVANLLILWSGIVNQAVLNICISLVKILPLGSGSYCFDRLLLSGSCPMGCVFFQRKNKSWLFYSFHDSAAIMFPCLLPLNWVIEGIFYPYLYHHSHVLHMWINCIHHLVHEWLFTVFVMLSLGKHFPCVSAYQFCFYAAHLSAMVSDCTTINDIEHKLVQHGFFPSTNQG